MSSFIRVNEIFFSIQGESTFAGLPCGFVRLAGCDLRCRWCDTEYAFSAGERRRVDDVVTEVCRFPTQLVEVTGGEPLLQKGALTLVSRLIEANRQVLIETGGHRDIREVPSQAILVYDIKCPDSGMSERNCWDNLPHLRRRDQIKFVLASKADYAWAKEVITRHRLDRRHAVLFSPVWESLSPKDLAEWVLEDGLDVRVQLQLHKLIWGAEARGV